MNTLFKVSFQRLFLLLTFTFVFPQNPVLAFCSTPPNLTAMNQRYDEYLRNLVKDNEIRIAVFPFQDGSLAEADEVMEKGFAYVFSDVLQRIPKVGVFHPFVVLNALQSQGLSSHDYYSADRVASVAASIGATHVVYGMFQRQRENLRYFVETAAVTPLARVGTVREFQTHSSERFFSVALDAISEIAGAITGKKIARETLVKIEKQTPTFEAFRYYVKGMDKSRTYNEVDLGIAKVWFEKATALSYTYAEAFRELARTLYMTALIYKQMDKDASLLWTEGNNAAQRGGMIYASNKKKKEISPSGPERWYLAAQSFSQGVNHLKSNDLPKARAALGETARLVPEDGLNHHFLVQAGSFEADKERALVEELKPCVE